jgi:CheY-like chemotaxis protein
MYVPGVHLRDAGATQETGPLDRPPTPALGRVLVVDDNLDAATTLAMVLRNHGHTVFTAHDGEAALRTGDQEEPDAIILDIGMPGMNGYEVAQRVRRTSWGNDVLLVALTGWGQKEDIDRALGSGFDAHLTKPADPERIERLLEEFLAGRNETGNEPARNFP